MSKDKSNKFSCLIIGDGTLPIRCAEILLRNDWEICAIASADAEVKKWAKENNIPHLKPGATLAEQINEPFDYLFSIVNEHILREDILSLPRKLAINYHDALLPRYAGTHATSWALMNDESVHGISWHVISDVVDAGDILKQQTVEISKNDTALTLNTKCYESAVNAFTELVEELSTGKEVAPIKQNLTERTFFRRFKRPEKGGVISWQKTAKEISALVRALNFGNHPNPLGTTKIIVEEEFFIVSEAQILELAAQSAAGTINEIGEDFLRISTADKEIILCKIQQLGGQPIPISDLTAKFNLHKGFRLAELNAETAGQIEKNYQANCKHENYWVKKLASAEPIVPPFASSTTALDSAIYETAPMPVADEVLGFLRKSSESRKMSNFVIAAFGAFLARLGGVGIFDVGYHDAATQSETAVPENLFAKQVPLRFQVDCLQNFDDFCKSFDEEIESIKKHQTYVGDLFARFPQLRSIVEQGEKFVFPVAVAKVNKFEDYQPADGNELVLVISENEAVCRWIYDRNKIKAENFDKLNNHFTTFLNEIVANSESQIAQIPLLTEAERHQILVEWNDNRAEYPKDKCLHHLFEAQTAATPEAIALISAENRLTYRELNSRANQLAHYLLALGMKSGELVGISAERSPEMIVGIWGVLKAGGAYVPLDPSYPTERLKFILNDTKLSTILTQKSFASKLENQCQNVVYLDTDWDLIAEKSNDNPNCDVTAENPAYVIYTSGSTGQPKGVLISHKSLVNHSWGIVKLYELESNDRILQFASFNFDVAAEEIFPTLSCGATVVLLPEKVRDSLKMFTEFLNQEKVTVVNLPVSYWRQWTLSLAKSESLIPETIRLAITGSERVLPEDYNLWRKISGTHPRWLNAYGLTETTITSLVFDPVRSGADSDLDIIPIGRPINNTEVYILDKNLQPVPVGITGQLYIGGDCLAISYLNQPTLTAEKFVTNPFNSTDEARLYKSGDLARYQNNGDIEYLDRIDNQVKIRGFRIELGEIETILASHPALKDVAVIAGNSESGETNLIAYIVPHEENAKTLPIELWASVGEYPVYDELLYYSMSTDKPRTSRYETAIRKLVKGKTVVEIGTGKDVILARLCIAAGAKKVYAIEALEDAYTGAKSLVESLGLSDRIIIIKGFSFDIELPEKVDLCLSEIIGTIGSSEGVVPILNDARRFLKEDGSMIPEKCVTKIAAVQMPDDFLESPHFSELSGEYAEKVFQTVGYKFDVRVCLRNFPQENLLSDSDIFEDLDFTKRINPEYSNEITLTITKSGRLDGFLLWLNLHTVNDVIIDNLKEESSWLPVYFPAFEPGIEVNPGDVIKAVCITTICDNGFNPDYRIKGTLQKLNGEIVEFAHNSFHHQPGFKQTPFYQRLFPEDMIIKPKFDKYDISAKNLREYMSAFMPGYMIPSAFVELDELPLTVNHKVNRRLLPPPVSQRNEPDREIVVHRDDIELKLVKIWETILGVQPIGVQDDFFELGGHSLQAIRMFAEVETEFSKSIPLATLFEAGTIEKLADILRQEGWSETESSLVPIQPNGTKPIFFCIHAKGGNVLFYRDLAKYMGLDQPFYGVQARRLGGRQIGHETVEEMAEFYIKEIQTIQPEGPYYLGGASFGGLAAFEIAQQLRQQGHKVALLALLDTGTPDYPKLLPTTTVFRAKIYENLRRIQLHYNSLKEFNLSEKTKYILEKLAKVKLKYRRKIVKNYKKAAQKYYLEVKGAASLPKQYIVIDDQIGKAGEKYLPKIYSGKMTLFRASNQPLGIQPDPTLGWGPFVAGGIEIHEVPGFHGSIVTEPFVQNLAEELNKCFALAQLESTQTDSPSELVEEDKIKFVVAADSQSVA